jgi:hypothetical protein
MGLLVLSAGESRGAGAGFSVIVGAAAPVSMRGIFDDVSSGLAVLGLLSQEANTNAASERQVIFVFIRSVSSVV